MAARWFRWRLAGLLVLAAVVTAGCNPLLFPFLFDDEAKSKAEFHLTNKTKPVRVVVISYAPAIDNNLECLGAEGDLCRKLVQLILKGTKTSKEKVDIVPPRLVDKFKGDHPDWYKMELKSVGDFFKADYVISLEVDEFNLYESNTGNLMFRGHAEINVTLQDMHDKVGEPKQRVFTTDYPKGGPKPADDSTVAAFKAKFLDHIASKISEYFVDHPSTLGIAED